MIFCVANPLYISCYRCSLFLFVVFLCSAHWLAVCLFFTNAPSAPTVYPSMWRSHYWVYPPNMWERCTGSSGRPGSLCDATTLKGCNKPATSAVHLHLRAFGLLQLNPPPVSHWASPCGRCPSPSLSSSPYRPAETGSLMHTQGKYTEWGAYRLKSQFCD